MAEKFIIRAIGDDEISVSKPMTKKQADKALKQMYRHWMVENDYNENDQFFECYLDVESGSFEITGEEYYQQAQILPVNTKTGAAFILEQIKRLADEAEIYATKYQYDLTGCGVGDVAYEIGALAEKLMKQLETDPVLMLTSEQRESIYREVQHEYLLEDAKCSLYNMAGFIETDEDSDDNKEAKSWFRKQYGFTLEQAVNPRSKRYVLERAVELYEKYQNVENCELGTWECAVSDACLEMSESVAEEKYRKHSSAAVAG